MVLEAQRAWADRFLRPAAEAAARAGFTPDGLTVVSFALAVLAGACLWAGQGGGVGGLAPGTAPGLLAAGGLLVLASAGLDAVDGRLARLQGTAGPRGDYLDHVTDRYADLAILLGIGLAPGFDLRITLLAVVGTLLTSYMGTQAQAVGVGRDYRGLLGRADRVMLLGVVPLVQAALPGAVLPGGLSPLAALLVFIGVVGNLTAVQRFAAGWRELTRPPAAPPAPQRPPPVPEAPDPPARKGR